MAPFCRRSPLAPAGAGTAEHGGRGGDAGGAGGARPRGAGGLRRGPLGPPVPGRCWACAGPTRRSGGLPGRAGGQRQRGWPCSHEDGKPIPVDDPMRHVGFRTSRRGLEEAKLELAANAVEYEEGDYGVAWSVYLPDPDGYLVEITTYEPAPAWSAGPARAGLAGPMSTAGAHEAASGEGCASERGCGELGRGQALDRRIVVVWTVQDALGYGLLTLLVLAMHIGAGLAGAGVPGPPAGRRAGRRRRAWPPGGGRGPATATGATRWPPTPSSCATAWSARSTRPSPTSGSSTSTSPRGRSSGWSACPGWWHTASAGTDATIPGIAAGDAEGLRRLILARAGHGDAVEDPGALRDPGLRRGRGGRTCSARVLRHQARLAAVAAGRDPGRPAAVPAARRRGAGAAGLRPSGCGGPTRWRAGPAAGGGGAGPQAAAVPFDRIQQVDLVRKPLHRLLGVATLRVETAGAARRRGRPGRGHPGRGVALRSSLLRAMARSAPRARVRGRPPPARRSAASKGRGCRRTGARGWDGGDGVAGAAGLGVEGRGCRVRGHRGGGRRGAGRAVLLRLSLVEVMLAGITGSRAAAALVVLGPQPWPPTGSRAWTTGCSSGSTRRRSHPPPRRVPGRGPARRGRVARPGRRLQHRHRLRLHPRPGRGRPGGRRGLLERREAHLPLARLQVVRIEESLLRRASAWPRSASRAPADQCR